MTQSSSDSGGHRCYRSSKRLGFVLLVIGGAAVIAALPFVTGTVVRARLIQPLRSPQL